MRGGNSVVAVEEVEEDRVGVGEVRLVLLPIPHLLHNRLRQHIPMPMRWDTNYTHSREVLGR